MVTARQENPGSLAANISSPIPGSKVFGAAPQGADIPEVQGGGKEVSMGISGGYAKAIYRVSRGYFG